MPALINFIRDILRVLANKKKYIGYRINTAIQSRKHFWYHRGNWKEAVNLYHVPANLHTISGGNLKGGGGVEIDLKPCRS